MQPQQVVLPVAAGRVLVHQVPSGQPVQGGLRRVGRRVGQRGGGPDREVGSRRQSQQPEHAPLGRRQVGAGQLEGGAQGAGRVGVRRQQAQPVAGQEPGVEVGHLVAGAGGQVGGRDAQRQRQVRAQAGQFGHLGAVRGGAPRTEQLAEQGHGLVLGKGVQPDQPRALARDQAGHPLAAGHQGQRARPRRQQRTHLLGVVRVVEQHQQPPFRRLAAVHGGGLRLVVGDPVDRHAEGVQEAGQRLQRTHPAPVPARPQADVELTVRKAGARTAGPVHRQRGLPDAAHARQHDHAHRPGLRAARGQHRVQHVQMGLAAGERVDVARQLRGHGRDRAGRDRGGRRRRVGSRAGGDGELAAQHAQVRRPQLRAGLDAEFGVEPLAHRVEQAQCRGLPAVPRQRQHQPCGEALVQRLLGQHRVQRSGHLLVPRDPESGVGPLQHGLDALLSQRDRGRMPAQTRIRPGERGTAPARPRLRVQLAGRLRRPVRPRLTGQRARPRVAVEIQLVRFEVEAVADAAAAQQPRRDARTAPGLEHPPQLPDVGVHQLEAGTRRLVRPQQVDDVARRDRPPRLDRQQRQQGPLHRRGQLDLRPAPAHRERAEHGDAQLRVDARCVRSCVPARRADTLVAREQRGQMLGGDRECLGQAAQGGGMRPGDVTTLQGPQRPHAHPGPQRQLLLAQPDPHTQQPQPVAAIAGDAHGNQRSSLGLSSGSGRGHRVMCPAAARKGDAGTILAPAAHADLPLPAALPGRTSPVPPAVPLQRRAPGRLLPS